MLPIVNKSEAFIIYVIDQLLALFRYAHVFMIPKVHYQYRATTKATSANSSAVRIESKAIIVPRIESFATIANIQLIYHYLMTVRSTDS